ncbi:Uncharacterised protein [Zhongshania aliphaticivorans]|uniref:Uncharacterized protein n=1 Tax=Zhongshania aliphaticivorans TaxID=1470434 RepID=A0A5S9MXS6_9GAMM|nr:hypothetical protein [Zhongshania aliphaticivorans]CAA0082136.1 Uncharacterised protein [Zhongshania aliphaticivorans]CAA0084551.1 Uncharacterised protein [Zhongshania aliphaticivorans]
MNTPNKRDSHQAKKIVLISALLMVLLGIAFWLFLPLASSFIEQYFSPGLGLKDAAVAAFFVTVITLVIFAVAAGDGLLGELQFILSGFLGFFIVLWLLIAWIF